jgi:hypothetical protein
VPNDRKRSSIGSEARCGKINPSSNVRDDRTWRGILYFDALYDRRGKLAASTNNRAILRSAGASSPREAIAAATPRLSSGLDQ